MDVGLSRLVNESALVLSKGVAWLESRSGPLMMLAEVQPPTSNPEPCLENRGQEVSGLEFFIYWVMQPVG